LHNDGSKKMTSRIEVALAVDIGGTKIRTAAVDRAGNLIAATRLATEAVNGAAHVLDVIATSLEIVRGELDPSRFHVVGLGLSSAGVIEPVSGRVVNAADQIPGWKGTPLGEIIAAKFALPTFADNDANCALVGEAWLGQHALAPQANVVMLTLGTGLGGAVMLYGRLISGKHHLTGHFGLSRMWDPYSATQVSVEHLVSGTGLGNVYQQRHPDKPTTSGDAVMQLVKANDSLAKAALAAWLQYLALQLHNLYWTLDPDLIIIGGGVTDSQALWWPQLHSILQAQKVESSIALARLGNDAGIIGAAKLVFDQVVTAS
jgi:glucokinase